MSSCLRTTLVVAAVASTALVGPVATGAERQHHRHHRSAAASFGGQRYGHGSGAYPQAYGGYYGAAGWEAETNARLTAQAYREPGVTLDLAPDAKETATGGPSGGVPGFSGH